MNARRGERRWSYMFARCGLRKRHSLSTISNSSTPEHLEMLGVDPTRLPPKEVWASLFKSQYGLPLGERGFLRHFFGKQANMHLHLTEPAKRQRGIGAQCVRLSVDIYFRSLEIKQLFCEPNAFNVGPNRTLQRAGFKYLKTHMTVPGPLNFHQSVNRWLFERYV